MTGRVIAIDASMCLYQFLVAVRQGEAQSNLSNASGEVTSHIQGFLSRTAARAFLRFCSQNETVTHSMWTWGHQPPERPVFIWLSTSANWMSRHGEV